jgi:hypothetical protein
MNVRTQTAEGSVGAPLLSVCIPTYNRAHLLRVALQALLPQVKQAGNLVEVWVSDNASPDNTPEVVEASRSLGPLRYSRNASNLGYHGNTVKLSTELATGEYVWVLGDDDVLMPGALRRILDALQANREIDSFYLNYGIADYPGDWPADATGGYTGNLRKLHVDSVQDRAVPHWKEFIRHETDLCTEMFCQITHRSVWVDYWERRPVDPPGASTTAAVYPHSVMWAETIMNKPSYYIGGPASVCFYGSQWYTESMAEIHLFNNPQLLRVYHKCGLSGPPLRECERGVFTFCESAFRQVLLDKSRPALRTLARFLAAGWPYPTAWRVLARAIRGANRPWFISKLLGGLVKVNRLLPQVAPR